MLKAQSSTLILLCVLALDQGCSTSDLVSSAGRSGSAISQATGTDAGAASPASQADAIAADISANSESGQSVTAGSAPTSGSSGEAAASTKPELQVTIIRATTQEVVGQAFDPAGGAPLSVELVRPDGGAPLAQAVANQDISEASRKGAGFKMDLSGTPLSVGDRVAVRAAGADGRTQASDVTTVAAPAAAAAGAGAGAGSATGDDPLTLALSGASGGDLASMLSAVGTGNSPNLSERYLCYAQQQSIASALNAYDNTHDSRPAGFTLQTLVKEGLMKAIPDDTGQGAGTSDHYVLDESGISGVFCTVHGSAVENSSFGGGAGANL
jgi:hypothetical protein